MANIRVAEKTRLRMNREMIKRGKKLFKSSDEYINHLMDKYEK